MRLAKLNLLCLCGIAAVSISSCKKDVQAGRQTIPLVEKILSGDDTHELRIMKMYGVKSSDGALAVIGNRAECESYSRQLMESDLFDNISGHRHRDGLPDFAGETIAAYIDEANSDFGGYAENSHTELLREIAVRDFLMASDTACSIAAFDTLKMDRQPRAKIVILASPHMAEYGAFDIDTLIQASKAQMKVISPILLLKEKAGFVGVITDSTTCESGIYTQILKENTCHCAVQCMPSDSTNILRAFIGRYIRGGGEKQLSTLVIEDESISADRLSSELKEIMTVQTDSNVACRKFIGSGMSFINLKELVAEECFRYLRNENLFTHYISYPDFRAYETVPVKGLDPLCYDTPDSFNESYRYSRKDAADYTVVESAISIDFYLSDQY